MSPVHHIAFAPFGIIFTVLAVCFVVALLNSRFGGFILGILIGSAIALAGLALIGSFVRLSLGRSVGDGFAHIPRIALPRAASPAPPLSPAVPASSSGDKDDDKALAAATTDVQLAAKQVAEAVEVPEPPGSYASAPAATPRPAWVDEADRLVDNEYHMHVFVGEYATADECEEHLAEELQQAVERYARRRLGVDAEKRIELTLPYIHEHVLKQLWLEQTWHNEPLGKMYTLHGLLVFDRQAGAEIQQQYKQAVVAERLGYAGAGAGLILGLLATAFGYLKLDTLTRGYYSGRLRLAAGLVILAEAAIAVHLARGGVGF